MRKQIGLACVLLLIIFAVCDGIAWLRAILTLPAPERLAAAAEVSSRLMTGAALALGCWLWAQRIVEHKGKDG